VIALYCDLRFASDLAKLGTAFSRRGLIAEHGISWLLPRLIGVANALDLLYSARLIDAAEALRMGLVNRVLPQSDFLNEVRAYGLMIGVELSIPGKEIVNRCMQEGLLLNCTHDTVLRFLPPYIITEEHVDEAILILDKVFATLA